MGNVNVDMIEKALETSDLADGGRLNAEQQAAFIRYVKKFSTLLGMIRFERMKNLRKDIDKIWVGEPVTQKADEDSSSGTKAKPKFSKIQLNATKTKSFWDTSTETFQDNIEQDELEMTIQNLMMDRMSTDMELLVLNGDEATYAGDTSPMGRLLKTLDGLLLQARQGHVVDFQGKTISKHVFSAMRRRMPKQYIGGNLKFFVSDSILTDWQDLLSDRGTLIGDRALQGEGISPYGFGLISLESMPDDLAISVTSATPATVLGSEFGPFVITASNDTMKLDIDNAGPVEFQLPHGTLTAAVIAAAINAADSSFVGVARDDREGRLLIQSPTTGASSEVDVQTPSGNSAYITLGLTVAVTNGTDSGTSGTINEGSVILFTHPQNFIMGLVDGTRIYTEYNKDNDRLETVVYNQIAVKIEESDGLVYGSDIRLRLLV